MLKFSLGFGPTLLSKKWGETEYLISALPLGGYVKMFGEHPGEDEIETEEKDRSFSHKSVAQRFSIVAGGPVFNLIFAVFVFFSIFIVIGLPSAVDTTKIGVVSPNSVAEKMGIKSGDIILAIDDKQTVSWEQVSELIKHSGGNEVTVELQRGEEKLTLSATPAMEKMKNIFGEDVGERYMLGISRSEEVVYKRVSLIESISAAFTHTWNMIYLTFMGIVKIIERVIPATELGGPIRIAELAGQQLEAGWVNFFSFMGLLSVNLGILNLLPIPVLDGGHLVFLTLEGIRKRPLSERAMITSQKIGIILLASLMVFVFYNDIFRLVSK